MRQWWPSASSSRSPTALRQREQLLAQPQPLVEVVDVQQRGVAATRARPAARAGRRAGAPSPARRRSASARARGCSANCRLSTSRARSRTAEQAVVRRSASSASSSSAIPSRSITPASAWRPAKPSAASASASRSPGSRASAAAANVARAAGSPARSSAAPSASSVVRLVVRAPVVLGRLLVGERGGGLLGGGERVADGLRRPALEEVVGELGRVRGAGGLQRLADAAVQAHAAARALGLVERLAHERVREGEAVELVGLADKPASVASSSTAMMRSSARRSASRAASRSNWRPITLGDAAAPGWRSSESCCRRREIISLTPSGTAIRLSARSSSSGSVRSVSSMKNGLPSVSSVRRRTNCERDVVARDQRAGLLGGRGPSSVDALERRLAPQARVEQLVRS